MPSLPITRNIITRSIVAFALTLLLGLTYTKAYAAPTVTNIKEQLESSENEKYFETPTSPIWAGTVYITWETNEPTTSKILYGIGTPNLQTYEQKTLTTKHAVRLQYRIEAGEPYVYQIISRNANGETNTPETRTFVVPEHLSSKWWETAHETWYKPRDFATNNKWIAASNGGYKAYCTVFNTAQVPIGGWIRIARHNQAGPGLQLYVNGEPVGSWAYGFSGQTFNISPKLQAGNNVIALYQDGVNYDLFTQGEVVLPNSTTLSLDSHAYESNNPINWYASGNPPTNWNTSNSCDTNWAKPIAKYDPLNSPFKQNIVFGLPGFTPDTNRQRDFSTTLSRVNKLIESTLIEPTEDRSSLSLPENAENAIKKSIGAGYEKTVEAIGQLASARTYLKDNNVSSFTTSINAAKATLADAEQRADVALLLSKVQAEQLQLTRSNELLSGNSSSQLTDAATKINQAIENVNNNNYSSAKDSLNNANQTLANVRTILENAWGYKIPTLNDSLSNPLGWLRFRSSPLFGMDIRFQNNQTVLKMKNDNSFAALMPSQEQKFSDAVGFLSPFAIIKPSGSSYSLGSGATNIAYEQNGQVVIKPASGEVYTKTNDTEMTKNWIFVWNNSAKNNAYLVVLQNKPASFSFSGTDLTINKQTSNSDFGSIVVFNPYADGASLTSSVSDLSSNLSNNALTDINKLSRIMTKVPVNYTELYRDEPADNRGNTYIKYSYYLLNDQWDTQPLTIAPWPTLLSFAQKHDYPGVNVVNPSTDSKVLIADIQYDWGTYRFAENTDTLHYYTPLVRNSDYMRGVNGDGNTWEIQRASELGFNTMRLNVGNLVLDYNTCGLPDTNLCGPHNTYNFKSGWQDALLSQVNEINNKGMKAVIIVWNAIRAENAQTPSALEANTNNAQSKFITGWQQIAEVLKNKNVVYDLVNEPEFLNVETYNKVMLGTTVANPNDSFVGAAEAIRSVDQNNPIVVEGWRNYAKDTNGMATPVTSKTYYQVHAYPDGYDQVYASMDRSYPGLVQDWWNNNYNDRDWYFEEFWKGNIRKMIQNKITFYSGEYGVQVMPGQSKSKVLYDMAAINYKYGIHQTYFKGTGWTMFDIYAGQGNAVQNDMPSINALLTKFQTQPEPPPFTEPPICTITALPGDLDSSGKVTMIDLAAILGHFGTENLNGDLNCDGRVSFVDISILLGNL